MDKKIQNQEGCQIFVSGLVYFPWKSGSLLQNQEELAALVEQTRVMMKSKRMNKTKVRFLSWLLSNKLKDDVHFVKLLCTSPLGLFYSFVAK